MYFSIRFDFRRYYAPLSYERWTGFFVDFVVIVVTVECRRIGRLTWRTPPHSSAQIERITLNWIKYEEMNETNAKTSRSQEETTEKY